MRAAKPLLSCFVLAFIVALLLDVAASAPAANVYWYKYNGSSNCWQTGYVGAESSGCDSVGPGFLATPGGNPGGLAHMANLSGFAGGEDTQLGTSGDYCNYYNTGDNIVDQETNDQAGYTGWEPPTPFGSYQESDAHGNTCQADGTTWGNEVRSTVSGGNCYSVCGMQHYVSLHQQGLNDRPWYGWFGEPSLVISTEAMLWAFEYSGEDVGDWGYTCPQIEDISTGNIIEYCLQEWRSPFNVDPIWDTEGAKECNSWAGHSYDQVQTYAYPGTDDASERSGSANTEVIKSKSGWKHFEIAISRSNLQNAINQINSTCGVSDSTNPQNWALIGIEQGLEGWRNFTVLGGASANLNLRTEYTTYTPYAPEPKTGKATEITGTSVTLNGAVVPYEPSYVWFQYGNAAFSGYEHFTPLTSVGLGTSEDPVSASTTNGIYPGTTYRFRTGASDPGGERFGPEEQFTTPATAPTLSTDAATQVKATSTQLNGEVWPNGLATTVHFEYGTTTAYGKATESFVIGAKGGEEHINEDYIVYQLSPATTYHYRIVAVNADGTAYGKDETFTTPPGAPTATSEAPTEVEPTSAELKGSVYSGDLTTKAYFEYWSSSSETKKTTSIQELAAAGNDTIDHLATTLTGLSPTITYYYRVVAENADGKATGEVEEFTPPKVTQCSGASVEGQGASVLSVAYQDVFGPEFHSSSNEAACSGTQGSGGRPTVTYDPTSSGLGLESWGVDMHSANFGPGNAFVITEEPPNATEKAEIEAHESLPGSAPESLLTIPVLQEAIAIVVHLPANCAATSTNMTGRLVLTNETLQKIFLGTIKTWTEITEGGDELTGAGCASAIKLVVRLDSAGTTHILKGYLNLINEAAFATDDSTTQTWGELSEGAGNTFWPAAATVVRPATSGDAAELTKVAETAGSIGYASLGDARANSVFVPPEGGKGEPTFWAPIQNDGTSSKKQTFEDPSTNGDAAATASANCAKQVYKMSNGSTFPPASATDSWSGVTSDTKEKTYPLCGIAYELSLTNFSAYPATTPGEEITDANFLSFILNAKAGGGQTAIEEHDYETLPTKLDKESLDAVALMGFY